MATLALVLAAACDVESEESIDDTTVEGASLAEKQVEVEPTPPAVPDGLQPVAFDTDRQAWVYDQDGDSFPDLTEQIEGTDLLDPSSNPGSEEPLFPTGSCRSGYQQAGSRLCISTQVQNAARYRFAARNCRDIRGQVCSYEDLTYLYYRTGLDATYNPSGRWIGNMVSDDHVLCGNRSITYNNDPDIANFEGTCHKNDVRAYWCCHDYE